MKKWLVILFVIVIAALTFFIFYFFKTPEPQVQGTTQNAITLTKENLPLYLENQQAIKALPKDAVISLRLYNFKSGNREWEEEYKITKSKVTQEKPTNQDFELWLDSKYLQETGDFCSIIKKAKANNDLGFETQMGKTSLLWKYKSVLSYKDCFGL